MINSHLILLTLNLKILIVTGLKQCQQYAMPISLKHDLQLADEHL